MRNYDFRRVALTLMLLSCGSVSCESSRERSLKLEERGTATQNVISDQVHNSGTRGFIFLPPMVPPPADYGDFLPGLPVTVRIDELTGGGSVLRTLATFTSTTGPEGEHLRI